MSQCDPGGGGRWPDTRPCGAHGSCVANALWGAGGGLAESGAQFVCACDSGWSSAGDFAFQPNEYCHVTLAGLLPMWSVALLAVLVVASVYIRVVKAYAIILREQDARKKRAQEDASEKHAAVVSLSVWRTLKIKAAAAFIFVFSNPTRTCLFTLSVCLLGFGILSLTKLIELSRRFRGTEDRGGVRFDHSDDMLIGLQIVPTVLYCISSMAFLVSGAFSSLIWCASAQAFYTRAEGAALRLNTQKELGIASLIHVSCYILPGIAVMIGQRLSTFDARPSLSGGALAPYEIVVALHFQLKALVPLATYIVDVRLARLVIHHLQTHDRAMHAKSKSGVGLTGASAGAAARGSVMVEPSRQSLGAPSSGKGVRAGSVIAAQASAALPEPEPREDVSRIGRASLSVSRGGGGGGGGALDRAPSTNPLFLAVSSTALTLPAGVAAAPARPGSAGLPAHARHPSLPLGPKALTALKRPKKLHRRNNSADSPITAGRTLKIGREAASAAGLPPLHTKYAVISDAQSASPIGNGSAGPVITHHRPIPSRPQPTLPSPSNNRSTMRASGVQLALTDALGTATAAPPRITPSPVRFHTAETDTDVPTHSRAPSVDPRRGSGAWAATAPSDAPSPKAAAAQDGKPHAARRSFELSAAASTATDRRKSLTMAQPPGSRRSVLNLPIGGTNHNGNGNGNVVIHMPHNNNSSMRRGTVTTLNAVSSTGQAGAITGAGAGSVGASGAAVSAQKSQAEMAEAQRSKLLEFCKRLAKHNRTTRTIAMVWLVVNTLFGWVPLLRSFTTYILPIQVLATVLAIFTLLRTLSPKANKASAATSTSGKAEASMGAVSSETNGVGGPAAAGGKEKSTTKSTKQLTGATVTAADGSRRLTKHQHRLSAGAVSPSPSPALHSSTAGAALAGPPVPITLPAVAATVPSAVELMQLRPVTPSDSETMQSGPAAAAAAVEKQPHALPGRVPPSGPPVLSSIPASLRKELAQDGSPRTPGRRSVHMSQRRLAYVEN